MEACAVLAHDTPCVYARRSCVYARRSCVCA